MDDEAGMGRPNSGSGGLRPSAPARARRPRSARPVPLIRQVREIDLAEKARDLAGKVGPRGAAIWPRNVLVLVERQKRDRNESDL
jgi:hypothetical protein